MLEIENVYQILHSGEFGKLISVLHENREEINSDNSLKQVADISIGEIIRVSAEIKEPTEIEVNNLVKLNLIHVGNFFKIPTDLHKQLTFTLIRYYKDNLSKAHDYAKFYPEEPLCASLITKYEKTQPKEVLHSQNNYIKITHNNHSVDEDCRISLFKSLEEQKMFLAFKRIFDTYQVYPNVALSSLIDYNQLKNKLNRQESNYFFKASVDLVIFEPFKKYIPIYFFELDSIWHDEAKSIENDKLKDKIFTLAGLTLYRIRDRKNEKISEDEFVELVKEVRSLVE